MTPEQRRQQIGRIHQAKARLGLDDNAYRDLLAGLAGERSCTRLDDRQINRVLDWMFWMAGIRKRQPLDFSRTGDNAHANLVRVCYALRDYVPPGFSRPPMRSQTWQERTCGRSVAFFEELDPDELWRLIEGLKAIARRYSNRGSATLDEVPLGDPQNPPAAVRASRTLFRTA